MKKQISPETQQKLKDSVEEIVELFDVERCSLMLRQCLSEPFEIVASQGLSENIVKETKIMEGEGIVGLVAKEGSAVHSGNISFDKVPKSKRDYKTNSFLAFPIKVKDKIVGVINITDKKDAGFFEEKDIKAIEEIAQGLTKYLSEDDCFSNIPN